jgi:hypothetical protein
MRRSRLKKTGYALFWSVVISGALLFIGCDSGGDTGPAGPAGPTGPPGPPGPSSNLVTTEESCEVCHTAGKIADIAVFHPDPTGLPVTLSNIMLTNNGGFPVVSFHAATDDGPVTDLAVRFNDPINTGTILFYIADLVPKDTVTSFGTWSTSYFERWAYEATGNDRSGNPYPHGSLAPGAASGDYTYNFVTGFGSAEALAVAPDYNPAHTQRLVIVVNGQNDPVTGSALTNNTVGFLDFVVPAAGTNAVPLDSQRMIVTADACKKCHSPLFQQAHHADVYLDTRNCDVCHSPLGVYSTIMQRDDAYLPVLVHQIHDSIVGSRFDWSDVTYPQNIENCVVCHTTSGQDLGSGNEIDNWKTNPTADVCGSCHTNVNFATGENHDNAGPQTNNALCVACHPASGVGLGMSVTTAHDTTPTGMNVPEYKVTLNITPNHAPPYVAGEVLEVRVTLTDYTTGVPVDPALYTTPQGNAGATGGGLHEASLYVYGSRAKSVPVLATGTVTDPAFDSAKDTPTQEHLLFVNSGDPQVITDSSGFGYRLLPIPADMEPGTYMVRVRIGDYDYVSDTNYRIESTAFRNIQIGTATVEVKVAGDACTDCHGTGTAPFHDARHAVVFDTDQCLSCHDQSGNFAIPLANRVHAVHSANPTGDIYNINAGSISSSRDWSDVTYPQNLSQVGTDGMPLYNDPRCVGCHTSGDNTYKTLPYMMPCVGCHTFDGDIDHMRQNGGPF